MLCRVSEIEAFRRWREDEEAELDALVARLRGEEPPSDRMATGTAFHSALEVAELGEFDVLQVPGYVFHIEADVDLEIAGIRELRAHKVYAVDGGELIVSGQVDALEALRIDDHKTTEQMDAEGYFAGYQWRYYLEIFAADRFRWNVFEIREASDRFLRRLPAELANIDAAHFVIHGSHRLEQYRYPGMAEDCARLAADFYRFARLHLPERFAVAEAA